MKAFFMHFDGEFAGMLLHGETRGKAKMRFLNEALGNGEYSAVRGWRIPGLDNKPITYKNAKDAGFEYTEEHDEEDTALPESMFDNNCFCEICRGVK